MVDVDFVARMCCGVIPPLNNNCWYYPTLKVFLYILVFIMVWIHFGNSELKDLFPSLRVNFYLLFIMIYSKWYQRSFLDPKMDFFFFFHIFQGKKRTTKFILISKNLYVEYEQSGCRYEFL
jgi:hypothetical protein